MIIESHTPLLSIGGGFNVNCPYCDTKIDSFNLGINPIEDYCNCWKCGSHNLHEVLSTLLNVPKRDLNDILSSYKGRNTNLPSPSSRKALGRNLVLPTDGFTKSEYRYLEKRGFDPDFLHEKYGVVGGGFTRKWHDRIIIPIYFNNVIVSWVGRSILGAKEIKELGIPRYKNLSIEESIINPKDIFYNLDNCRKGEVVLTEGCFDVIRFGDDWICSLGTQLTQTQLKLLYERFNKVYIMFDNEVEAQEKARKFGMQIASMGIEVEVVDAYSEFNVNDGGECNEEQVLKIRKELGL